MERPLFSLAKGISGLPISLSILLVLGCWGCAPDLTTDDFKHKTWQSYGGGNDQSKYFIQDQITTGNVGQLQIDWSYSTGDAISYFNNPIVVDSVLYVMAKNQSIVALNALTGEEIWIHADLKGISRRGLSYWENSDRTDRRLVFTMDNSMQAINAQTGLSILSFGNNGLVDLRQGLGRDPGEIRRVASHTPGTIFENLILIGSSPGESYMSGPGHVRAYDVVTGEMKWIFHTIPQPGEFGYETWPPEAYKYAGGVNCWGEITVDEERGIAYFPLGSPTYDYYGADRHGSNLFGNCLLALDARTGERLWHFQTVHHDLWDYDLTSAPQLITVNLHGRKVDAVVIATKQGFIFAFDRITGEPIWPIEEKPVPASDVPGEKAWPTQPFPVTLPPFTRQTVNPEDISDLFLSQEEYESWKARVAKARKDLYTPIATEETIAMPGAVGGANFGNTAANPKEGFVYVLSQDYPSFYKLELQPPPMPESIRSSIMKQEAIRRGGTAAKIYCSSCHGEDLTGTVLGPSLLVNADRLNLQTLSRTVLYGAARMPPVLHIGQDEIEDILALLKDQAAGIQIANDTTKVDLDGPVVASGGAPGLELLQSKTSFNRAGNDYPEGVEAPPQRYYTGYGLGFPYILKPPWTSITAYDLNAGKIKWSRPLGEDSQALAQGVRNSGVPTGSQRNGMIVTSNGLIFSTVTNGKVYAYNAENGEILWTGEVPMGIGGIPSMYEIKGRTYLIINATTPRTKGWNLPADINDSSATDSKEGSYVVFALPE